MKKINIKKEFAGDYITREAGERLRQAIVQAFAAGLKTELDFSGIIIASTSFFDEGLAKLALHGWEQKQFEENVIIKNLNPRDRKVLEKMCAYRGLVLLTSIS